MDMVNRTMLLRIVGMLLVVLFGIVGVACSSKKPLPITSTTTSIRTMSTGELLYAGNKLDETNWDMVEVLLPGYLSKKFPFGAVQFRHTTNKDKCLMSNGFWMALGDCSLVDSGDYRTLFSLLPTSSGALQIQSIASDGCLVVESSGKKIAQSLRIKPCFSDRQSTIDLRWLWILTPPIIDAKLSEI